MEKRGVISDDDTPDYSDDGERHTAPTDVLTKAAEDLLRAGPRVVSDALAARPSPQNGD